jgi:hypothetical protein
MCYVASYNYYFTDLSICHVTHLGSFDLLVTLEVRLLFEIIHI